MALRQENQQNSHKLTIHRISHQYKTCKKTMVIFLAPDQRSPWNYFLPACISMAEVLFLQTTSPFCVNILNFPQFCVDIACGSTSMNFSLSVNISFHTWYAINPNKCFEMHGVRAVAPPICALIHHLDRRAKITSIGIRWKISSIFGPFEYMKHR